ncbi:MAG: helix-turn-helix domain-containing protein [Flavobacteriia bacterium]|nr:helix-turn-helix domain-containing protein [Flavobacteriia bacterium]
MNNTLSQTIKRIRKERGFSQDQLAEKAGLSLRTIQRIEAGETTSRGDTVTRIAEALNVRVEELLDSELKENAGFNSSIVWSSLSFLVFPLLGPLLPLIIWLPKKGRIKGADKVAARTINFQATWLLLTLLAPIGLGISLAFRAKNATTTTGGVDAVLPDTFAVGISQMVIVLLLLVGSNIVLTLVSAIRVANNRNPVYPKTIPFTRERV